MHVTDGILLEGIYIILYYYTVIIIFITDTHLQVCIFLFKNVLTSLACLSLKSSFVLK